jgi:hypothetical protein
MEQWRPRVGFEPTIPHDTNVRAGEDGHAMWPRGHCDRPHTSVVMVYTFICGQFNNSENTEKDLEERGGGPVSGAMRVCISLE